MQRAMVAQMTDEHGNWRWPLIEPLLPQPVLLSLAAKIGPKQHFIVDSLGWKPREDQRFTVKSTYEARVSQQDTDTDVAWKMIAKFRGPPKIKFFLWLVGRGRVLVNVELKRRNFIIDSSCPLCVAPMEYLNHLLRQCPSLNAIWNALVKPDRLSIFFSMNIRNWIVLNLDNPRDIVDQVEHWDLPFGAIIWNIWLHRNAIAFDIPVDDEQPVLKRSTQ
ncbi:hypothetical protein F3Y22_tig00110174pilonHSYRG00242 [Hibiscus syriacus]|uniref:Reverse transcriptase zinc-binding domain-containing protein n=1 Tax=Hibiscus syriacus TaxID=106335 RepID=A0A6A3BIV7_HIBSY|nr:hypothetical protein F3Y22_tig00110174pilonHSYRG00242 [Hibiscus syriacus]